MTVEQKVEVDREEEGGRVEITNFQKLFKRFIERTRNVASRI